MDWTYPTQEMLRRDQSGMETLLREYLEETGGTPPRGTRFLSSAKEMMETTRMIEHAVEADDHLHVGFQRPEKLLKERIAYDAILRRGVRVTAYVPFSGASPDYPRHDNLEILDVPRDRRALSNQWFLISQGSTEIAFVGYDISSPDNIGVGGATDSTRKFTGFITDDGRIVESLVQDLRRSPDGNLRWHASEEAVEQARGAEMIAVLSGGGPSEQDARTRSLAIDLAARIGSSLVFYDRSAESWLVDPYPYPEIIAGDHILSWDDVLRLQRPYLADQIDEARTHGVIAGAWLPPKRGAQGLQEFTQRFSPDLLVLPSESPPRTLMDRLRGRTLAKIAASVQTPLLLADDEGNLAPVSSSNGMHATIGTIA